MRARSVTEFIRDNRASRSAQRDYRVASQEIGDLAAEMKRVGDHKRAREFRVLAFVAANAARSEYFDPEPPATVSCRVCRGRRVCDITAHLARPA